MKPHGFGTGSTGNISPNLDDICNLAEVSAVSQQFHHVLLRGRHGLSDANFSPTDITETALENKAAVLPYFLSKCIMFS